MALKAIAKALKIKFEKSTYNPEFVAEIKERMEDVKKGNFITLDPTKSLWENLNDHSE